MIFSAVFFGSRLEQLAMLAARHSVVCFPDLVWRRSNRVIKTTSSRRDPYRRDSRRAANKTKSMAEQLILKRASASRSSGEWNDDDFDVLADGGGVGRIMKAAAVPVGMSWMWTLDAVPAELAPAR